MTLTATSTSPMAAAEQFAAQALRQGYRLEALHEYVDHDGQPLFWRIRAKHPGTGHKWIRPMHLRDDRWVLGEPPWPNGRPLYRLQNILAAEPATVIVVVEGETCADALAALGLVATTSGGATSAAKAAWGELARREVLLWPDRDHAGGQYADEVELRLNALECHVRRIDVDALGLEEGEDAVDWLRLYPGAAASDVLALAIQPSVFVPVIAPSVAGGGRSDTSKEIAFPCDDGAFFANENGVWFVDRKEKQRKICSPVQVIAKTRNRASADWGYLLEWRDPDRKVHRWTMPVELLHGDGADLRRELARRGLSVTTARSCRERLNEFIQLYPVDERMRCVDRTGWFGDAFVRQDQTVGRVDEPVVFQSRHSVEPGLGVSGTAAEWREKVGAIAAGNSRLIVAISAAFGAPLLELVGAESGGFHLRGSSSTGKTTALLVAASVYGRPDQYLRSWRATANGLEAVAAVHNDLLLVLDELGELDPKAAGEVAYMLANGRGKSRATREGTARPAHEWRLFFLSSGEESLAALMTRAGQRVRAGQEVRLIEIDADAGAGRGLIEAIHDFPDASALVAALRERTMSHHGAVGLAWLEHVVGHRDALTEHLPDLCERFVREVLPEIRNGQAARVAQRFALVAVAGELATEFGLTGWPVGAAKVAATTCFRAWFEAFGSGPREEAAILAQVRSFFQAHGASRFQRVQPGGALEERVVVNRVGFIRQLEDGERRFLLFREIFESEVCRGFTPKQAIGVLIARRLLLPAGDGRAAQKHRVPGSTRQDRFYVFSEEVLGDEN